jgi:hypothetical protein
MPYVVRCHFATFELKTLLVRGETKNMNCVKGKLNQMAPFRGNKTENSHCQAKFPTSIIHVDIYDGCLVFME